MRTMLRQLAQGALALCVWLVPGAWAAQPFDKASIYVYIDARKASGHPWHGPGDLIIPPPVKHVPTPITRLPEAPGAVLCIVTLNDELTCPGARASAEESGSEAEQSPLEESELPDAVEKLYSLLQAPGIRAGPTRDYRELSRRLFGRVVAPDAFCDPPRCPGDKAFVEQVVIGLRDGVSALPDSAARETESAADGPRRLQSPCPSSYECEFYDIALPPDEVFGLIFIDPAMLFINLVDGVIITRTSIKRSDARLVQMDGALRRAAAKLAPPGPWEAKRRLRAFSVRGIEDCVAAKCRATQSEFKLEPEPSP